MLLLVHISKFMQYMQEIYTSSTSGRLNFDQDPTD